MLQIVAAPRLTRIVRNGGRIVRFRSRKGPKQRPCHTDQMNQRGDAAQGAEGVAAEELLRHHLQADQEDRQHKDESGGETQDAGAVDHRQGDEDEGGEIRDVIGHGDAADERIAILQQRQQAECAAVPRTGGVPHPHAADGRHRALQAGEHEGQAQKDEDENPGHGRTVVGREGGFMFRPPH